MQYWSIAGWVRREWHKELQLENFKERDNLRDLGVNGTVKLKWILKIKRILSEGLGLAIPTFIGIWIREKFLF
jgi:hypothetical protein